jgi:hypothetical protein
LSQKIGEIAENCDHNIDPRKILHTIRRRRKQTDET